MGQGPPHIYIYYYIYIVIYIVYIHIYIYIYYYMYSNIYIVYIYTHIYIYMYIYILLYILLRPNSPRWAKDLLIYIYTYIYKLITKAQQSDQNFLCTWWLKYYRQVHKDFLFTLCICTRIYSTWTWYSFKMSSTIEATSTEPNYSLIQTHSYK